MLRRCLPALLLAAAACPRPAPPPPAPPPAPVRPNVPEGCLEPLAGEWLHADDPTFHYLAEDDGGTVVLLVEHHLPRDAGYTPRRFGKARDGGVDAGPAQDGGPPLRADAGTRPGDGGSAADGGGTDVGPDAGLLAAAEPTADGGLALDDDGCMPRAPSPTRIVLQRTLDGFVGQTRAMVLHPSWRWCELTFKTDVVSCRDGGLTLRTEPGRALGSTCEAPAEPAAEAPVEHRLIRPPRPAP